MTPPDSPPVLVISGASGLVGRALVRAAAGRYALRLLTRDPAKHRFPAGQAVGWDPAAARKGDERALETLGGALEGAYAIINLAGASIADGRLGREHQQRVLSSRLESAQTLLAAARRCSAPPQVWFQASATGYYGDRGDAELGEEAPSGEGVLAEICRRWEAAPEDAAGARLVLGRIGVVFAREAPAWRKLLLPIKLGLGGPLGSGQQWLSWIHLEDLAEAILFLLERGHGPYNLTAPGSVRQLELSRAAAARLRRPALFPTPAPLLRLALGKLADELLLASAKVRPARLLEEGFAFRYPTLERALDELVG
ncbi:TIGR01777 family oxidoreductase [Truepera radiovictrix]|uniref:NAD-dependent epimerase/dehydratase n=1 Tax=Truepera radiovictrix (strain DSM 17093 / CIP 108686 / LMG 22925 / RQ-24) TaxID=649638 RepID=D7CR27_TRURR|nr:TIGR01777 family oxidoreductase [Truepera radiovictrix]ADI13427.1 domain of unknown function DUF1731 [Truepera radiovictrix DSM 17093]WMT58012.1 TIGR01777 family oxidoreductase [Truepera radiovictrix]